MVNCRTAVVLEVTYRFPQVLNGVAIVSFCLPATTDAALTIVVLPPVTGPIEIVAVPEELTMMSSMMAFVGIENEPSIS